MRLLIVTILWALGTSTCHAECNCRCYTSAHWQIAESTNFQICSEISTESARALAEECEKLRAQLAKTWLGEDRGEAWSPKCQVLLYRSRQRYISALGQGSETTVGSSLIDVRQGRVHSRRIDIDGSQRSYVTAALPHELTHVVVKDRFLTADIPRWADEGMAILADQPDKQKRHADDLNHAIASGTAMRLGELLTLNSYPQQHQWGLFYGQSASVVKFLVDRDSPERFIIFLSAAEHGRYDDALRRCYGIAGVAGLHREWHSQATPSASEMAVHEGASTRRKLGGG